MVYGVYRFKDSSAQLDIHLVCFRCLSQIAPSFQLHPPAYIWSPPVEKGKPKMQTAKLPHQRHKPIADITLAMFTPLTQPMKRLCLWNIYRKKTPVVLWSSRSLIIIISPFLSIFSSLFCYCGFLCLAVFLRTMATSPPSNCTITDSLLLFPVPFFHCTKDIQQTRSWFLLILSFNNSVVFWFRLPTTQSELHLSYTEDLAAEFSPTVCWSLQDFFCHETITIMSLLWCALQITRTSQMREAVSQILIYLKVEENQTTLRQTLHWHD